MILNLFSHSADQTFYFSYAIGQSIDRPCIFLLQGSLGVGKTVFCKGLICGLGYDDPNEVTSPSLNNIKVPLRREFQVANNQVNKKINIGG